MDRVYLLQAGKGDSRKEWKFFTSIESENGFENSAFGCSYDKYIDEILPSLNKSSLGIDLPEGYVPQTTFLLYRNDDVVGIFKVRHYVNENTRHNGAGHIGYGLLKEYRGLGLAKIGLNLAIKELIKMPDYDYRDNIILGCHKTNIASLKVQEANGAKIIEETDIDYITSIPYSLYKE